MKFFILIFVFFFTATYTCIAQDYQDVVYLTNGNIVRGFIIELIPYEYLDIRTSNGRIRSIEMDNVERIVKERVRTNSGTQNNARLYQNNSRTFQNNNRSYQNDARYVHNNNRVTQNTNRYTQNYDDKYYTSQNSVHFGLKAGLNLTDIAVSESKIKSGVNGGIFGEFKFNNFAIQPEFLFSMQGANSNSVIEEGISFIPKYSFNYFNIPLILKYYVIDGLAIEIGPQLGILLSGKTSASINGVSASVDMKNYMKDIDFSLNFGASYQLPYLPLGFYTRYSLGVTDIVKEVELGEEPGKNRVFQVGVFVKF